jgi:hypothetical protein
VRIESWADSLCQTFFPMLCRKWIPDLRGIGTDESKHRRVSCTGESGRGATQHVETYESMLGPHNEGFLGGQDMHILSRNDDLV